MEVPSSRVAKWQTMEQENQKLKAELKEYQEVVQKTLKLVQEAKEAFYIDIAQARAEAENELKEKIHKEIAEAINSNYKVKEERQKKEGVINDDFTMYCDGKIHALSGIDYFITNLE